MPSRITNEKRAALRKSIQERGKLVIAYSGGVDSGLLLILACDLLGTDSVCAVTFSSSLLPQREVTAIERFVQERGIRHQFVPFSWQTNEAILNNGRERCFYCKREMARLLFQIAAVKGISTVAEGVTASDYEEDRPGLRAATEAGVWHPLAEAGLTKREVRELAADMKLPFATKPASPCLATRVEYGERLTAEKLERIASAEAFLHDLGFTQVRVRLHHGGVARIELNKDDMGAFCEHTLLERVSLKLKALGFRYVTLDLEGYRSGSMDTSRSPSR
ncbi:MAG: ATP-dependent sacrificial sulfur transferase LarE [Candidatus Methanospirareceae archaeon]